MSGQGYSGYTNYSIDPIGRTRFYGTYRATVVDNQDPQGRNRLSVLVPQVSGSDTVGWAEKCSPAISGAEPAVPAVNSSVWVVFENGDPGYPIWIGVRS